LVLPIQKTPNQKHKCLNQINAGDNSFVAPLVLSPAGCFLLF
jgi:hypothetical protein